METMNLETIETAVYLCRFWAPVDSDVVKIENGDIYFANGKKVNIAGLIVARDEEAKKMGWA